MSVKLRENLILLVYKIKYFKPLLLFKVFKMNHMTNIVITYIFNLFTI